jgi:serine protease Do
VSVRIAERPSDEELARLNGIDTPDEEGGEPVAAAGIARRATTARASLGLTLQTLTPELALRGGLRGPVSGVLVSDLDPNSDAAQKGIRPGDIIIAMDRRPTPNTQAVNQVVAAARQQRRNQVLLIVRRGNGPPRFIAVQMQTVR